MVIGATILTQHFFPENNWILHIFHRAIFLELILGEGLNAGHFWLDATQQAPNIPT
jgi:hypothetical protein